MHLDVDGHQLLLLAQLVTFSTPTFLSIGAVLGVPESSEVVRSSDIRLHGALGPQKRLFALHSEKIILHNRIFCVPRGTQVVKLLSVGTGVEWFVQV